MRAQAFQTPAFTAAAMSDSLLTSVSMSFFLNGNCHFVPGPTSTTLASASASFSRLSRRGRLELSTSSTMFCERAADELVAVPVACLSIFSHPIDAATLVETLRHKRANLAAVG